MLDPVIAAGMIFSLLMVLLIGGFVVLYPLTSKLGQALEAYLEQKKASGVSEEEITTLRRQVHALTRQVEAVAEKQDFVEELLEEKSREALGDRTGREAESA